MSRLELEVVTRFLYTDEASLPVSLAPPGWLAVLELANRLVLPRLVTLLEREAISSLGARLEAGAEVTTEALQLLQPCQVRVRANRAMHVSSIYTYLLSVYPVPICIYSTSNQVSTHIYLISFRCTTLPSWLPGAWPTSATTTPASPASTPGQ